MQVSLRLESRPTWRLLTIATALLSLGHVVNMVLRYVGYRSGLLTLLDLNEEQSFGTLYSVVELVACAAVLFSLTFAARRRDARWRADALWWLGLGVLFVFMSADEGLALHEALMDYVQQTLHASGVLYYAWVIPYAGLVVMVVLIYARFLLRLPRGIAIRFVIAGAVYVGGALGLEMVAGYMGETQAYSKRAFPTWLFRAQWEVEYLVEETMEMLGAAYFLVALLRYIELGGEPLQVTVTIPDATAPPS
jgi:hypothetical protein